MPISVTDSALISNMLNFQHTEMRWLLIIAAFAALISLIEAWLATFIIYGKSQRLKQWFPATHNLIRSHIDYLMMTFLLGVIYFMCQHLNIVLPTTIIVLLCFGALYNPVGFIIKAINPKSGNNLNTLGKLSLYIGFLPTTIGVSYPMVMILMALL